MLGTTAAQTAIPETVQIRYPGFRPGWQGDAAGTYRIMPPHVVIRRIAAKVERGWLGRQASGSCMTCTARRLPRSCRPRSLRHSLLPPCCSSRAAGTRCAPQPLSLPLPLHSVYVACAAPLAPRACSSQRYCCCQCGLCPVQHACTPAYAGTSPRRLPSRSLIWRLSEWRSVRGCLVWGICRTERPYIPLTTNTRRCASTSRGRLSGAGWLSAESPPSF